MRFAALCLFAGALIACSGQAQEANAQPPTAPGSRPFVQAEVTKFDSPWALAFLPDGRMLVTEKAGRLLLVSADGKEHRELARIPVDSAGQGGLMDVVLHPKFAENRFVYISATQAGPGGKGVVLMRGRLAGDPKLRLEGLTTIFRATPFVAGNGHYSGRIAFAPDGHLFFTNGERQKFTPAQDPKSTLGKVLRLNDDGTPAAGNPLAAKGFHPAIWSYGHRNILGIAFDTAGNLWEDEMGPMGGDEVNLILPGRNYGWPKASNGSHYDGRDIPDHRPGDGYEPPKVWWNPSISPSSLMIYSGKLWPEWKGDLFIGALSGTALVRVDVNGTEAKKGDEWDMEARIRGVREGPDGAIWVLEDGDTGGRLWKLTPKK
ncbi:MAG TPA: PQQ-dependent sugar dehydrogenase [Sphingomonas sp.]|nr:PQQ-dependent sugar dehydrogenase [Sphingomonas sp.]